MAKSVLFISKRADAASTRYRIMQFIGPLRALGWRCEHHGTNADGLRERLALLARARHFDIVVVQRKLFTPVYAAALARANPRLVFDYDDAVFLNDDGTPSARRLRRFQAITRRAQLALAGNRYLAAASTCGNTLVLPTGVDLARYAAPDRATADEAALTLVWIGSASTRKYLEQHRAIFLAIGARFPNVTLKIISDFAIDFSPLATQCIAWSAEAEVAQLQAADVGVAPMADDPWTRGKCGLKVIQYMACGLPVLSSNAGANADIILHNETGLLAANEAEWLAAIDALHCAKRRAAMGKKGRERVAAHYSIDVLARRMDEAFTRLLTEKSQPI